MIQVPRQVRKHLLCLSRDEEGAAATEWAVLASSIAAVAVVGITSLGQGLAQLFGQVVSVIGGYF